MNPITITRGEEILAHHTTDSPLSHYGQPVWVVEVDDPEPGLVTWSQEGEEVFELDILGVAHGWLLGRQPQNNAVIGIIWSDGNYFADCLVDKNDRAICGKFNIDKIPVGAHIRNTVFLPGDEGIGAILSIDDGIAGML